MQSTRWCILAESTWAKQTQITDTHEWAMQPHITSQLSFRVAVIPDDQLEELKTKAHEIMASYRILYPNMPRW